MSRFRTALPVALGAVIALLVAAFLWFKRGASSDKPTPPGAPSFARTVVGFHDCMLPAGTANSLRERILLSPRSQAVFKECQGLLANVRSQLPQSAGGKEFEALLAQLEGAPFSSPAGKLSEAADVAALGRTLEAARSVACRDEPGEPGCRPRPKVTLTRAVPVFDVALPEPTQGAVEFASHASPDGSATLAFLTRGRAGVARLWVARSGDAGRSWKTQHHDLPPAAGTKRVTLRAAGKGWFVVVRERESGETLDAVSLEGGKLEAAGRLELAAGKRLLRVGGIAARVRSGDDVWTVVGVQEGADRIRLRYLTREKEGQERTAPKVGRPVGLLAEEPPRLLLHDVAPTGFFRLWQVTLPPPGAPWPEPMHTTVPYVDELKLSEAATPRCGLPKERFDIITAQGPKKDAFFVLSGSSMYPFKFEPKPESSLQPVCGTCPPGLLERTKQGLRLFLPIRRSLSGMTIDLAAGYSDGVTSPVGVGCMSTKLLLAYLVGSNLVVQPTKDESWRYAEAKIVARDVSVADVAVLGWPKRALVAWRTPSRKRLQVFAIRR